MQARRTLTTTRTVLSLALLGVVGCGAAGTTEPFEDEETLGTADNPIRDPTAVASMYPEAALISMDGGWICSGSVIAPRVVLTAGHCVEGRSSFTITTPYAKGSNGQAQTRYASGKWTNYASVTANYVNPNSPDVGLLFVDTPFQLPTWPTVSSTARYGAQAVNVGRINDGTASYSNLYVGSALTLTSPYGYPYSYGYASTGVTQPGDSGGPMFLTGTHTILAVCSGGGVAARTDTVFSQIDQLVRQNGGWGSNQGTTNPPATTTPPPSSCTGEISYNEDPDNAQKLSPGNVCGKLSSATDEDWYTFDANTGYRYDIRVQGTGVTGQMWKCMDNGCFELTAKGESYYAGTSNAPGTYYLGVWSNTGATGSYTIAFKQ